MVKSYLLKWSACFQNDKLKKAYKSHLNIGYICPLNPMHMLFILTRERNARDSALHFNENVKREEAISLDEKKQLYEEIETLKARVKELEKGYECSVFNFTC